MMTMGVRKHLYILLLHLACLSGILCQSEICKFYGLQADCRYRVDAVCLSHITSTIDQCTNPVQVKFTITCENPYVDFSHTFSSSDTLIAVHGYKTEVQLRVRLTMKEEDVINVEADFHVHGLAKADFINSEVKLRGIVEHCPLLNEAAKIAIGVMAGLVVVAGILIIVLLYVRYKRRAKNRSECRNVNQLVENAEEPGQSTPRRQSTSFDYDTDHVRLHSNHVTSINSNIDQRSSGEDQQMSMQMETNQSGDHSRGFSNMQDANHYMQNDAERCDVSQNNANGVRGTDVRYSDILRRENGGNLKISDC